MTEAKQTVFLKVLIGFMPPNAKDEVRRVFQEVGPEAIGTTNPIAIFLAMVSLALTWWKTESPREMAAIVAEQRESTSPRGTE